MVLVLCMGSEHTVGSAQHAGWQHRHMAHDMNPNNNGSSSSSPLAFHFHRCASVYQNVASLLSHSARGWCLPPVPRAGTTLKKVL